MASAKPLRKRRKPGFGSQTTRSPSHSEISSMVLNLQWLSLDGCYNEGWTGSRHENLSISAVPEPTSLALLVSVNLPALG